MRIADIVVKTVVLVFTNYFTKWPEAYAIPIQQTVAKLLVRASLVDVAFRIAICS